MEEPQPPEPGECCGSGCSPCVWDIYYDKLEKYENWKEAQILEEEEEENEENHETKEEEKKESIQDSKGKENEPAGIVPPKPSLKTSITLTEEQFQLNDNDMLRTPTSDTTTNETRYVHAAIEGRRKYLAGGTRKARSEKDRRKARKS